ncbi:YvcK family protein [Candidatus Parcubacteria bacterium]|nr:YvcK family protein [Candidatus Parcubacteria bacterium]
MKKVVTIGGGTGQAVVLVALRNIANIDIKAIVSTMDDGGSTGRLRQELGILPPADPYRCVLALSPHQEIYAPFLRKRFSNNKKLRGHRVGNMLLAMLDQYTGSFKEALGALEEVLEARGRVLPITTKKIQLCAEYSDGYKVCGEDAIDDPAVDVPLRRITRLYTEPEEEADKEALMSVTEADYIILGPGDLYTSVLANVVVKGMGEAIKNAKARLIFISNIMSKRGQTHGMKISDLVNEIGKYCLRKPDFVIINNGKILASIKEKYQGKGEHVIVDDFSSRQTEIIKTDIVKSSEVKKEIGDRLFRSYVRHDASKLNKVLEKIIKL